MYKDDVLFLKYIYTARWHLATAFARWHPEHATWNLAEILGISTPFHFLQAKKYLYQVLVCVSTMKVTIDTVRILHLLALILLSTAGATLLVSYWDWTPLAAFGFACTIVTQVSNALRTTMLSNTNKNDPEVLMMMKSMTESGSINNKKKNSKRSKATRNDSLIKND